jgi:ankyrin repeat protein
MMAARFGNLELTKLLLAKGAKINDVAKDGVSVLMVAVLRGHATLAMFLLDQGADPTIDKAGYTALHWAAGAWESTMTHDYPTTNEEEWRYLLGVPERKAELISALIAHGANVNARITKSPPRYGINLTIYVPLNGATPFLLAAGAADVETMKLLVAKGADPMLNTDANVTPLMMAAGLARSSGDTLVTDEQSLAPVELCLQLGNDVNAASSNGDTALHAAAYTSYPKLAQLLLERGANVNQKNKPGNTPLKVAEGYTRNAMLLYRPEVAEVLRKFGGKTE